MSKQLAGLELLAQSTSEQQEEVTTPPTTWPDPLAKDAYYYYPGILL